MIATLSSESHANDSISLLDAVCTQAASMEIVEHAALLHDVADWKYVKDEEAGRHAVKVGIAKHL